MNNVRFAPKANIRKPALILGLPPATNIALEAEKAAANVCYGTLTESISTLIRKSAGNIFCSHVFKDIRVRDRQF